MSDVPEMPSLPTLMPAMRDHLAERYSISRLVYSLSKAEPREPGELASEYEKRMDLWRAERMAI